MNHWTECIGIWHIA